MRRKFFLPFKQSKVSQLTGQRHIKTVNGGPGQLANAFTVVVVLPAIAVGQAKARCAVRLVPWSNCWLRLERVVTVTVTVTGSSSSSSSSSRSR
ncbi:hypothetical protein ACLKA6_013392 [Drosophila palustris]